MAVMNMQTVASCVAKTNGVEVAGTDCAGSLRTGGIFQAPILSLFSLPLPGSYPMPTASAADLRADENAAAAQAAERTGRSGSEVGANPSAVLARSASGTVLSTRSPSLFATIHQERKPMIEAGQPRSWSRTSSARG